MIFAYDGGAGKEWDERRRKPRLYLKHLQMALLTSYCQCGREGKRYRGLSLVFSDPSQPFSAQPCAEGSCPIWSITTALLSSGLKEIIIIESAMGIQTRGGQGRGEPGQHQDQWYWVFLLPQPPAWHCYWPAFIENFNTLFNMVLWSYFWFLEMEH